MRRALLLSFLSLTFVTYGLGQKRGLKPEDFYKEVTVSDVQMSPKGNLVAFTAMTINEKENKRHTELWMQKLQNGKPDGKPFRFSDPTEESSSPRWSPDGSVLAFRSKRGKDKNSQWFLRVDGPGGEAYHIDGVEGTPNWSPDGKWIAFTKSPSDKEDDEEGDNDKREGWIAANAISKTLDQKRFDGRVVTSSRYKRDGTLTLMPDPSIRKKDQLFLVAAEGGEATKLTDLPFDVEDLEWSPDSSILLFSGDEEEDKEFAETLTSDLYVISRSGGTPKKLTTNPGSERNPTFSPQGTQIVFFSSPERGAETDLMVVDVDAGGNFKGQPRNLTPEWDLGPGAVFWTPDGRELHFGAGIGGNTHLFKVSAGGGEVRQITSGDRQLNSVSSSKDGQLMAYTVNDAVTPTEVYVARGDGSQEQRLTSFNDEWLSQIKLMPAEPLHWKVADGTQIEGWVIKPVDFDASKKYPLILKIHGGPHGAYGNTFFRTFHVLSNAGFFVLYPNPRGSTGYGHKYTYATRGKWGELDKEDYLGGVDAAVAKYSAIDPQRVGVSGGSYGGYMTNWLTATTDRFAAAVTSRSITNWESWYGASDAQGLTDYEFYGPPWEQRELYRRLSPISYVENVTAPTLIIHSENDFRTPIADGEQWFIALKRRGVPVEMVRYPRSSHGLSRNGEPWLLVDRLERIRSWFSYWLIEHPREGVTTSN